ncbi:VOC family protein [Arthrobacter sp. Sa2CUA1]|uniref:VOC family protein n=1 Tax=Arthrobacter gallicola TaxID=2762225 RepID=A0ABR8UP24_9MICC|nr:VOC family protein [Arthrobacter gallicola]MBD7994300.1 VOC family protein [Arthrobacter gallicola]
MLPQLSVVTLGVRDVEVTYAFYARLGWEPLQYVAGEVVFFQVGHGVLLSFFRSDHLAAESGATGAASLAPVTLGHNVDSPNDVDVILHEAAAAGGSIAAPGTQMSWGGYSGYFTDPDGFRWEVCHNPGLSVDANGKVTLSVLDPLGGESTGSGDAPGAPVSGAAEPGAAEARLL